MLFCLERVQEDKFAVLQQRIQRINVSLSLFSHLEAISPSSVNSIEKGIHLFEFYYVSFGYVLRQDMSRAELERLQSWILEFFWNGEPRFKWLIRGDKFFVRCFDWGNFCSITAIFWCSSFFNSAISSLIGLRHSTIFLSKKAFISLIWTSSISCTDVLVTYLRSLDELIVRV